MTITRRIVRLATCVLVAALGAAGCGPGHHDGASATRPARGAAPPSSPPPAGATPDPRGPSVHKAPAISADGMTPLVGDTAVTGDVVYPIPGGIRAGKTLAIAVNCQGPGRLTVRVRPAGVSFRLLCEKGRVLPTLNEIAMSENHSSSSLRFTSGPGTTWSFAAGWDPNPPERREAGPAARDFGRAGAPAGIRPTIPGNARGPGSLRGLCSVCTRQDSNLQPSDP